MAVVDDEKDIVSLFRDALFRCSSNWKRGHFHIGFKVVKKLDLEWWKNLYLAVAILSEITKTDPIPRITARISG